MANFGSKALMRLFRDARFTRAGRLLAVLAALVIAPLDAGRAQETGQETGRESGPSSCAAGGPRAAPAQIGRYALLIGNQSYTVERPLTNPFDDIERICQSLEQLGFQVTIGKDLDRSEIFDAIWKYVTLVDEAPAGAVSFFYYSGHGASIAEQGDNFLIPVEADISGPQDLKEHGYNLNDLIVHLSGIRGAFQKSNFVVLDACRNIVLESGLKSSQKGLVPVRDYGGVFVAFAAGPGQYALDEPYYSKALATALLEPNRSAYQVFRNVRQTVYEQTKGEQFPWMSDGLLQDYYFNIQEGAAPGAAPQAQPIAANQEMREGRAVLRIPGCDDCPPLMPINRAELSEDVRESFAIALYEVSFDDWERCRQDGGCPGARPDDAGWGGGSRPVINVSHDDAIAYTAWLTEKLHEARPRDRRFFRLPTDGEWTIAAEAGGFDYRAAEGAGARQGVCRYANGGGHLKISAFFNEAHCADEHERRTAPVASADYRPNGFGLSHMLGNVWEWVAGCADGGEAADCPRALRGGSWETAPWALDPSLRRTAPADLRRSSIGFRVVLDRGGEAGEN